MKPLDFLGIIALMKRPVRRETRRRDRAERSRQHMPLPAPPLSRGEYIIVLEDQDQTRFFIVRGQSSCAMALDLAHHVGHPHSPPLRVYTYEQWHNLA